MNFARADLKTILADATGTLPVPGAGALIPSLCWVRDRDDAPLSLTISSTAIAVGTDTLVTESADCQLTAFDWGSLATGTVSLAAFASGPEDGLATASAENLVEILDADVVFLFTTTVSGSGVEDGTAWGAYQATTSYWAIDIDGMKPRGGPIVIEIDQSLPFCGLPADLDGNAATFDISNVATGDDSFVDVLLEALTVEDAMSSVTSIIEAVAANDPVLPPPPACPPPPVSGRGGMDRLAHHDDRMPIARGNDDRRFQERSEHDRHASDNRPEKFDRDLRHEDREAGFHDGWRIADAAAIHQDGDGWHGMRHFAIDSLSDIA